MLTRRQFLSSTAVSTLILARSAPPAHAAETNADLVIVGGGVGGCAAALSAAMAGKRVVMTEPTDWIGGQLTSQAVPPDENRWIETSGGTKRYQEYRTRVRDYYRQNYPLTDEARNKEFFNPGNGNVSALCHEPKVSLAVLNEMLAPYVEKGLVTILLNTEPIAADVDGDRVAAIKIRDSITGSERVLTGRYFIDASEFGDLLPLTKTEYVTGAESREQTGELHAAATAQPANMQAFTCCFAVEYVAGEDHTIEKPREYDLWRAYVPQLKPAWPGPLLSLDTTHPQTLQPRTHRFDPPGETRQQSGLWMYRRILDKDNFKEGAFKGDICLVNWPQNDYWLGNIFEVEKEEARKHLDRAKQLSLSLLYWLQTEAPRPDGKTGWRELRLRKDVVGTEDGLAKHPYVRESRRILAEFTVKEQHVGKAQRAAETGVKAEELKAEQFADTVGIGYYRIDLHPGSGGDNYIDIDSLQFQIPLGALIPRRVENLLPACKNPGVTHITNGCFRLHPVEWNIGESAGALAAFCLERDEPPRHVRVKQDLLADFQRRLQNQGVRLSWA